MNDQPPPAKALFDRAAQDYDHARRQVVPCFDDLYGTALDLLPFEPDQEFSLVDLGTGTGLFAAMIADRFPKARITLMEVSNAMLDQARKRFDGLGRDFEFIIADYAKVPLPRKFDAVVSALSIHHLVHEDKRKLFEKVRSHLNTGGVFINADQVAGHTQDIQARYDETWLMEAHALGAGIEDLEAAIERRIDDKSARLVEQLTWMEAAGFANVNVWYKNGMFAVMAGEAKERETDAKTHSLGATLKGMVKSARKRVVDRK